MPNQVGTGYIDIRGNFSPFDKQMGRFSVTSRSRFAKVGKLAAAGMAVGFGAGAVVLKKSLAEWQEAEKVGKQTGAVLKSTGAAANVSAKQVSNLAGAISRKAGIDDEAIQSGENLLLTFTRIRNEQGKGNKIFNEATKSIVDMSAAMDQDLKSSAIQVGKALNDPVKGMTALQRVGVTFSQQQKDRVALWVKEGHQVKAQKLILGELSKEFGGSAAAQATGLDKAKVAVNNLAESLGKALGPEIEKGAGKVAKFVNQMQSGKGAGGEFADDLRDVEDAVVPVAKAFGEGALKVGKFAAEHKNIAKLATAVGLTAVAFNKLHIPGALRGARAVTSAVGGLTGRGGLAGGIVSKSTPVPVFVTNPGFAGGGGGRGGRGPGVVGTPGSRAVVPSAPRTPFSRLPAGVRGAVGSTAIGLGAVKVTTDFFKDHSDLGLLDQFASKLERVAKAGDAPGMRALAQELRDTANANKDLTKGEALRAFANELDKTADSGGKDIHGLVSLFSRLEKHTASDLDSVGQHLRKAGGDTKTFGSRQAYLADQTDKAETRVRRLRGAIRALGGNLSGTGSNVDALRSKLEKLKSRYDVEILLQLQARGAANLSDTGFPRPRRDGGLVYRGGGMVPAMLSPGEVGITPDGGSFRVPGSRVAADNFATAVPSGTAILTDSGQGIFSRTGSMVQALRNQLPHFQRGGVARSAINVAALAAEKAGFKSQALVNMLAIAGRESHWNPRAQNLNASTGDHSIGLWQINQLAHHGKFGTDSQLMNPLTNARAAKSLYSQAGLTPWHSMAGATQYLDDAKRAVSATRGGGSFTAVTPAAITHPILSTQLRPLIDDALMGGVQAGIDRTGHAGRVDLLQSVLEGIVPESTDRATRERVTRTGGRGGATGPIAKRVQAGVAWAKGIAAKHMPYQYAGGHGTAGVGNPSFDCSGYSSGIAHAMGLLNTPLDTTNFANWGLPGKGKNVTFGIRGGAGRAGHMMAQVGGHYFESGGGHGPAEVSGWDGAFTTWRHPGWRKGGVVGLAPPPKGQRHLERIAKRKHTSVADLLDPHSQNFVGFGLRTGGTAQWDAAFTPSFGGQSTFDPKQRRLFQLIALLGQDQLGTGRADRVTRALGRNVQGRSIGALVRAQQQIRRRIKRMARKGFTGPERIRTRRLRGALTLLQDEMGRPIGRAIGRAQDTISSQSGDLQDFTNRQTISGVDPESAAGLSARRDFEIGQAGALMRRRAALDKALKRARKTPGKADDRAVVDQIKQTDSALLALGADLKNLEGTIKDAAAQDQARAEALAENTAVHKQVAANQDTIIGLARTQGPELERAFIAMANGGIAGRFSSSFPATAGLGGLDNT